VFDGVKLAPYHEFDAPNPICIYGRSKLAGEHEAERASRPTYIVRTAMVYDESGRNFVNTMRRLMAERDELQVVDDQRGNPTYAGDLANGLFQLLDQAPPGIYHLTNSGAASWFEWAREIASQCGFDVKLRPIPGSEFSRAAKPPDNGELVSLTLSEHGISMPDWRDALRRCLA
jgi:dTDP-4-dehydrorhamnose reductase